MKEKAKRYLLYGIIGGILSMIGDCLLLGADSSGVSAGLDKYAVIAQKISYTRIGLAGFFGFIGIPITVFGFYALYMNLADKESLAARLYRVSLFGYAALGGAVHIICCYMMTGIKKDLETGTENLLMSVVNEQGGYVLPSLAVFFIFYLLSIVTMIILVAGKKTPLPGWMWIMNPLTFKILINVVGRLGSGAASLSASGIRSAGRCSENGTTSFISLPSVLQRRQKTWCLVLHRSQQSHPLSDGCFRLQNCSLVSQVFWSLESE